MMDLFRLNVDSKYEQQISQYKKLDGYLAVICYLAFFSFIYIYAKFVRFGFVPENVLLQQTIIPIIFTPLLISILLIIRGQKINTIGISNYRIKESIIAGVVLLILTSLCLIFYNIIIVGELRVYILYSWVTYLIYDVIQTALMEEVIFRGYIATRLRGLFKNRWVSIILGAIMFSLVHIAAIISVSNLTIIEAIMSNWVKLSYTFVFHIIAQLIHEKYNNLAGPIILHGIGNILVKWML